MEPISLLIVVGIIVIYLIVSNVKFNREYRTLMEQKEERESQSPMDNNKSDITLRKINTIKEEKTIITCLEELYCWINENTQCFVRESYEDSFIIEALNNTDLEIKINESHNLNVNIKRIIKQLEKFDGSEKSKETMNFNFAASCMLDFPIYSFDKEWNEAEFDFHFLADQLRDLLPTEEQNENIDDISDYDDDIFDD